MKCKKINLKITNKVNFFQEKVYKILMIYSRYTYEVNIIFCIYVTWRTNISIFFFVLVK